MSVEACSGTGGPAECGMGGWHYFVWKASRDGSYSVLVCERSAMAEPADGPASDLNPKGDDELEQLRIELEQAKAERDALLTELAKRIARDVVERARAGQVKS
jgi:hypothetical protein